MGLPYGRNSFKMDFAVQSIPACDRHPTIQPPFDSKDRAYSLRRACKKIHVGL